MILFKPVGRIEFAMLVLYFAIGASAQAQISKTASFYKDVAYDHVDASQKLDVYLAKSETPTAAMIYIHGGGWIGGSKNSVPSWLTNEVSQGWLSVISVEYRFTNIAIHPAQVNDCLRAIQTVRQNAASWNIDPTRIGVTGGSAGGHLSLWVALHDDIANEKANDLTSHQSSRVACAVSFAGPTDWSLLQTMEHTHPAYRQLLGYKPGTPSNEIDAKSMGDVSPITFASRDDPPIMQVHGDKDDIVPIEHARRLNDRLKELDVKSELVVVNGGNHSVAGAAPTVSENPIRFIKEILLPSR